MTPERLNKLVPWLTAPLVLVVAIVLWFMYQGLERVAEPIKHANPPGAVVLATQCENRTQSNAPNSSPAVAACITPEQAKKNGSIGLMVLRGAIFLTIAATIWNGIKAWRKFLRNR
ncbi:MAG: hypothetical protein JO002_11830 [Burkholderiaceae bacterium]|nr:hypothetical protein [Burkholderiaceae bacterium]